MKTLYYLIIVLFFCLSVSQIYSQKLNDQGSYYTKNLNGEIRFYDKFFSEISVTFSDRILNQETDKALADNGL